MENFEGNSALLNHFCYFFQIRTFQKSRDSRSVSRMILSLCPVPSWTQCGPDPRPQWIPMNPNGSQWIPDHNVVTLSTWWPFLGQWHFTRRVVFIFKSVNDLQALQFRNTTVSVSGVGLGKIRQNASLSLGRYAQTKSALVTVTDNLWETGKPLTS